MRSAGILMSAIASEQTVRNSLVSRYGGPLQAQKHQVMIFGLRDLGGGLGYHILVYNGDIHQSCPPGLDKLCTTQFCIARTTGCIALMKLNTPVRFERQISTASGITQC